jgi:hypothetical protein
MRAVSAETTTFARLRDAIAQRWTVTRRSPAALLLALTLDGRAQKVLVEAAASGGVIVVAEVGAARLMGAAEALEYNATAERGALAVARGVLALRTVLGGDTTVEELEGAIRAAAIEAARLHRSCSRPMVAREVSRAVFAHLAE